VLAYNITNWAVAPGPREARLLVTCEKRQLARRRARARVEHICRALAEPDTPRIRRAIANVICRIGFHCASALVDEAKAIHDGPGMLVRNGSRPRTVGGIFFQLSKLAAAPTRSNAST
jgi:Phosphorylated adapter RNA export protein, RNA-binding domain